MGQAICWKCSMYSVGIGLKGKPDEFRRQKGLHFFGSYSYHKELGNVQSVGGLQLPSG